MKTSFRQELIKGSRDRFNESPQKDRLDDLIVELLKNNEILKEIHQARKSAMLRHDSDATDLIKDMMKDLPMDDDLAQLLKNTGILDFLTKPGKTHPKSKENGKNTTKKHELPYKSRRFPSIFKLDLREDSSGKALKGIPLNGKGILRFSTDVEDEYLFRPQEKGELRIELLKHGKGGNKPEPLGPYPEPNEPDESFDVTTAGPTDQTITVSLKPKESMPVGSEVLLRAVLTSPNGDLECAFWVKILDPIREKDAQPKKEPEDKLNLPSIVEVYENPTSEDEKDVASWAQYNWTGEDVLKVIPGDPATNGRSSIDAIAINMDSFALKRFLSKKKVNEAGAIRGIKNKYLLQTYLHFLYLYSIINRIEKTCLESDEEMDIEEKTASIFQGYAPFLLALDTNSAILSALETE